MDCIICYEEIAEDEKFDCTKCIATYHLVCIVKAGSHFCPHCRGMLIIPRQYHNDLAENYIALKKYLYEDDSSSSSDDDAPLQPSLLFSTLAGSPPPILPYIRLVDVESTPLLETQNTQEDAV